MTRSEFWSHLIAGAKLGNELLTTTWLSDPDGGQTLDVYFDNWAASARAGPPPGGNRVVFENA